MEQYSVTGMSCAACSSRVEKAVSKVPGVTSCSVSLLTNSMGVEGTATSDAIISAVEAAGYHAEKKGTGTKGNQGSAAKDDALLKDTETPKLKKKAVCFGWFFTGTDVFLDGAYDVELASAIFLCGKPCGDGTASAAFDGHDHGHQPEILYQWF